MRISNSAPRKPRKKNLCKEDFLNDYKNETLFSVTLFLRISTYGRGGVALADVAVNASNFPDEAFRTWVSENVDKDSNDSLSDTEIAAVTEIDLQNKGITNLTGIEHFKANLRTLNCSFNNLKSLNLQDFTALNILNCSSNKSMTSLNVKGCEILSTLTCDTCALEGTLDLTGNTVLSHLGCSDNPKLTVTLA
ncbi:MAG: hypothetical protein IJT58_02875, partial [Synergistaceae bacterium]|nr:hypothetical protein [Synergistaceae bacterium]